MVFQCTPSVDSEFNAVPGAFFSWATVGAAHRGIFQDFFKKDASNSNQSQSDLKIPQPQSGIVIPLCRLSVLHK